MGQAYGADDGVGGFGRWVGRVAGLVDRGGGQLNYPPLWARELTGDCSDSSRLCFAFFFGRCGTVRVRLS